VNKVAIHKYILYVDLTAGYKGGREEEEVWRSKAHLRMTPLANQLN
jgi:hypothetical protein